MPHHSPGFSSSFLHAHSAFGLQHSALGLLFFILLADIHSHGLRYYFYVGNSQICISSLYSRTVVLSTDSIKTSKSNIPQTNHYAPNWSHSRLLQADCSSACVLSLDNDTTSHQSSKPETGESSLTHLPSSIHKSILRLNHLFIWSHFSFSTANFLGIPPSCLTCIFQPFF